MKHPKKPEEPENQRDWSSTAVQTLFLALILWGSILIAACIAVSTWDLP